MNMRLKNMLNLDIRLTSQKGFRQIIRKGPCHIGLYRVPSRDYMGIMKMEVTIQALGLNSNSRLGDAFGGEGPVIRISEVLRHPKSQEYILPLWLRV